jgi:UDP-N-acetylmuramoylalanine--D-glutamate ligase
VSARLLESTERWAVWGLGRSGVAAANLLARRGHAVLASDSRPLDALSGAIGQLDPGVEVRGGANAIEGAQVVVVSPGLKPSLPVFAQARAAGAVVIPEIELAWEAARAPHLAITGTDGKTTTTSLLGAIVAESGREHVVAGNIGTPLCEVVEEVSADGLIVAEVSAFQLWSTRAWRAAAAAVTNVAGDHLDYFDGSFDAYADAKRAIFAHASPEDWAVLWAEDARIASWAPELPGRILWFSERAPSPAQADWIWREGDTLRARIGGEDLGVWLDDVRSLPLKGPHNARNLMAAAALAHTQGIGFDVAARAARGFAPLAHRMEWIRDLDGLSYWDDSKATNAHAAMVGLSGLDGAFVPILGGVDKGLDLGPLAALVAARAPGAVVIGEAAGRFTAALVAAGMESEAILCGATLERAVAEARGLARRHGAPHVSLSPACSSFDMFDSYAHRGRLYQEIVRSL